MDVKRNAFDLLVRAPSTPHKITYRRADNELICGEFDYVEQLEYFENDDEPTKLIKETWLLVKSEVFTVRPTGWSEDEDE